MSGPNATTLFKGWVGTSWRTPRGTTSTTAIDVDTDSLKLAFYQGASMSGTFNFETDVGYGAAPWNTTGEITASGGTGVGWSNGGIKLSDLAVVPTVAVVVDHATLSVAVTISPITLGPGAVTTGGATTGAFDHILLYSDTVKTASASAFNALAVYYMGGTLIPAMASGTIYVIDFADTPQVNNAIYGS